jgi:hypothetical protein
MSTCECKSNVGYITSFGENLAVEKSQDIRGSEQEKNKQGKMASGDQVKYASKLRDAKVLVIGGSSGMCISCGVYSIPYSRMWANEGNRHRLRRCRSTG